MMYPPVYRMLAMPRNPFQRAISVLLALYTLWSLFFLFLWNAGAFVFIVPSGTGDSSAPSSMGPALLCGGSTLIASFLPFIIALTARGTFPWLAAGWCSSWISAILWIAVIGPFSVVLLYFLPLPTTTTAALGFFWLYERSRGNLERGKVPGASPRPPGAPPRID